VNDANDLIALEERGWHALSSGGASAAEFYEQTLDRDVVMLLPGGLLMTDRDEILRAMSGQPWTSFHLEDTRVLRLTADTGVVVYAAVAERAGSQQYSALISSIYVRRDDGWKLAFHQQTPR
jgi:hypothetical protein